MAADVWNSLAGYVIIKIEGMSLERVMNRAVKEGIGLWNVRRERCSITACVGVRGFYALRSIVRGMGCKVRIVQKHGLLIGFSNMRFRKVMLYGWIAALALLLAASRFLWLIQVDGLNQVKEEDVRSILADMGISPGVRRGSFDAGKAGAGIMASDDRIAWAGAELTGVILSVSVREAEQGAEIISEGTSSSIYAAKDGVITEITALCGKPLHYEGDAVLKGDLLIAGDLGNDIFVQARGEVMARVLYRFEARKSRKQTLWAKSGNTMGHMELFLKNCEVLPNTVPFERWEKEVLSTFEMPGLLPFRIRKVQYSELTQVTQNTQEALLLNLAMAEAEIQAAHGVDTGAVILSKQSDYTVDEDGITYTVNIIAEENIAQSGENTLHERTENPGN